MCWGVLRTLVGVLNLYSGFLNCCPVSSFPGPVLWPHSTVNLFGHFLQLDHCAHIKQDASSNQQRILEGKYYALRHQWTHPHRFLDQNDAGSSFHCERISLYYEMPDHSDTTVTVHQQPLPIVRYWSQRNCTSPSLRASSFLYRFLAHIFSSKFSATCNREFQTSW